MIAHPLTSKHQQQIEGSTSAHASSRSVASKEYDGV